MNGELCVQVCVHVMCIILHVGFLPMELMKALIDDNMCPYIYMSILYIYNLQLLMSMCFVWFPFCGGLLF